MSGEHMVNKTITRKPKTKSNGPRNWTRWLLEHQFALASNLVAVLLLAHTFISPAREYTTKFLTLSYYNPLTGTYAAGHADFCFMGFCVVLLTGLRAGIMDCILAPLAKRWGTCNPKKATRFAEQGWMFIYYSVFWPLGMYLYYTSPYFLNMPALWTSWPQRALPGLIKSYILTQWSFWIQQLLVINIEDRRKDHWQMLTHHFVTIALLAASFAYHQTKVANLVLVLMDVSDLVLSLAKCLKYLGFTTACDILFGVFILSWFSARHVFYLFTCWSVYVDFPKTITRPDGGGHCYAGPATNLSGPVPVPNGGWGYLLEPFVDPAGMVCMSEEIMYAFLAVLLFLQVMMVLWGVFIARVAVRVVRGDRAEDVRSDGDGEGEGEIEVEGGNRRAQRSRDKRQGHRTPLTETKAAGASASGVWFPGYRDRKELLNRIGCEKQID